MPGDSKNVLSGRTALIVAALSAIVGSTGGPFLLVKFGGPNLFAPDRYTGAQGLAMERRVAALENHLNDHPDAQLRAEIAALRAELAANTARQDQILTNQNRIFNRLDSM